MNKESVNVCIIDLGKEEIGLECIGDQVIVLEDKFKSGYECSRCDGEGYLEEDCEFCKGVGKENPGTPQESLCRMCCPRNLWDSGRYSLGKKLCPLCEGKGALIVAPQTSELKPSSGVIKSVGPEVYPDNRIINTLTGQRWNYPMKIGDRILYSRFAGTGIELKQKSFIRILHAHEAMCILHGTGKWGKFTR